MSHRVTVRGASGKRLRGTARHHAVVTDRPVAEGGSDAGCTSGELLLLAIGSCAAGSIRGRLDAARLSSAGLTVDVFFEAHETPGRRDRIVISVELGDAARGADLAAIREAATTGGVTSRVGTGSELVVRIPALDNRK